MSQPSPVWRRSLRCDTNACIEAALMGGDIVLRDSKRPDGPVLRFSKDEWDAFIAGVQAGDFSFD